MSPTLLIGVGPHGSAIVEGAQEVAASLRPEVARVLRTIAVTGSPGEGDPELGEAIRNRVAEILNPASLHEAGVPAGTPCEILIVTDANEPESTAVSDVIALARKTVNDTVAGTRLRAVVYLLIPRGATERGAAVRDLVNAVGEQSVGEDRLVDCAYLMSGVSPAAQYTEGDSSAMLAWVLALRIADPSGDTWRSLEDSFADVGQRMSACGLSVLELDTEGIARKGALEAAHRIVRDGLLPPCDRSEDVDRIAEKAISGLNLTREGIRRKREAWRKYDQGGQQRDVFEDLTIPHIAFERVPRRKWHVLIGNYALYFRRERLEIARHRVQRNIESTITECEARIHSAVDSVVQSGRDPSNAFRLLKRLNAEATNARGALTEDRASRHEKTPSSPRLASLLPKLADAVAREPYLPAMIFRAACAGAAVATAIAAVCRMNWIPNVSVSGPASAAVWGLAFLIPFACGAVTAWRRAQNAMFQTNALRDACLMAIQDEAREKIHSLIEAGLDKWTGTALFLTAKPEELERIRSDYSGPNEWQAVEKFLKVLREQLEDAIGTREAPAWPAWRISIEPYALRPPSYPYANTPGFDSWTDEASTLIANDLFSEWRTTTASKLAGRIEEHALGRMDYVRQKTLDDFYTAWIADDAHTPGTTLKMYNDVWHAADPSVMLEHADEASSCALSALHPSNVRISQALHPVLPAQCQTGAHLSNKRWVLLRVLAGVRPEKLAAWKLWCKEPGQTESGAAATEGTAQ